MVKFGVFVPLLLLLFSVMSVRVNAENKVDATFYRQASLLAHEFSKQQSPTDSENRANKTDFLIKQGSSIRTGQGGNLLGFPDSDDGDGIKWIASVTSVNSVKYNHDQLSNLYGTSGEVDKTQTVNALLYYAQFGYALKATGFDVQKGGVAGAGRYISGGVLYLVYIMANIGPMLMGAAIKMIRLVNPFLLINSIAGIVDESQLPAVIKSTSEFVGAVFTSIRGFSLLVLMPITIGVTVFNVLVFRKGKPGKSFARLFLKVFMVVAGVSLVGATYTSILDEVNDLGDSGVGYTDYMILSSLVDFESWAMNTRLALPSNFKLDNAFIVSTDDRKKTIVELNGNPRMIVARVNAVANNDNDLLILANSLENGWSGIFAKGLSNLGSGNPDSDGDSAKLASYRKYSYNLITRYLTGESLSGSDYEGQAKGVIRDNDDAYKMWTGLSSLLEKKNVSFDSFESKDSFGYVNNIFNAGSLVRGNAVTMTSGNTGKSFKTKEAYSLVGDKALPPMGDGSDQAGMTPLSMYNYLNTDFGSSSLMVYSPERSTAFQTMTEHRSVNFVGGSDGMGKVSGYLETVLILATVAAISGTFAWSLFSITFLSIYRILPGIFGSITGSIQGITKLLIVTVALLTEVIGSIFMYGVINHLYLSIMFGLDDLVYIEGLNGWQQGTLGFVKGVVAICMSVLIIVMVMKHSRKFVKAMDEMATATIQKLMGTLDQQMNQDNPMGQGLDHKALDQHRGNTVDGVTGNAPGGAEHAKQMANEEIQAENARRKKAGERGLTATERQQIKGRHQMGMAIARGKDATLGLVGLDSNAVDTETKMHEARMRGSADFLKNQSEIDFTQPGFNENAFTYDGDDDFEDYGSAEGSDDTRQSDDVQNDNHESVSAQEHEAVQKETSSKQQVDAATGAKNTANANKKKDKKSNNKSSKSSSSGKSKLGKAVNVTNEAVSKGAKQGVKDGLKGAVLGGAPMASAAAAKGFVDGATESVMSDVDELETPSMDDILEAATPKGLRGNGVRDDQPKQASSGEIQNNQSMTDGAERFYEDVSIALDGVNNQQRVNAPQEMLKERSMLGKVAAQTKHVAMGPARMAGGRVAGYKDAVRSASASHGRDARRVAKGQRIAERQNSQKVKNFNNEVNNTADRSNDFRHMGTGSVSTAAPMRLVSQTNVKSTKELLQRQPLSTKAVYEGLESFSKMGVVNTSSYRKELSQTMDLREKQRKEVVTLQNESTLPMTPEASAAHKLKLEQAKKGYEQTKRRVNTMKKNAPSLIHVDGLSFDGMVGGRFKGDAEYTMTSLKMLDSLLNQRTALDSSKVADTTQAGRLHRKGLDRDITTLTQSLKRQGLSESKLSSSRGVRQLNQSMKTAFDKFVNGQ